MPSQPKPWSQGSSASQSERYKEVLNPVRDPSKNFDIDICEILQEYLSIVNSNEEDDIISGTPSSLNFSEAALILQGSTNVYGKKVDYLRNLVYELSRTMHSDKKTTGPGKTKDSMVAGRKNDEEFCLATFKRGKVDSIVRDLVSVERKYSTMITQVLPLPLLPLDEKEKGDIEVKTVTGEVIGKTKDLQVVLCEVHYEGCVFLPTIVFKDGSDASFSNSTFYHTRNGDDESMLHDMSNGSPPPPVDVLPPGDFDDNDLDMEDNYSVHDDPIMDSPAACDTPPGPSSDTPPGPSSDTPPGPSTANESQVPPPDMMNGAQPRRRSERVSAKVAAELKEKEKKKLKDPWSVETDKIKDKNMPLVKGDCKTPSKDNLPQPKVRSARPRSSVEFINEMRNRKKRNSAALKVCPLDSKILKNMPTRANVGVNALFRCLLGFVNKVECSMKQKVCQKSDIDTQDSPGNGDQPVPDQNGAASCEEPIIPGVPDPESINLSCDGGGGFPDDDDDDDGGDDPDDGNPAPPTFEDILRAHVDNYLKGAEQFTISTELSERVKEWEDKIKPIIEAENEREVFNIHQYGTRIIDSFENNNRKQTLPFSHICRGKTAWEICRLFLASLVLANNNNVEITSQVEPSSGLHDVNLTLLSRKRHQEQLDAFGHNSGEHE